MCSTHVVSDVDMRDHGGLRDDATHEPDCVCLCAAMMCDAADQETLVSTYSDVSASTVHGGDAIGYRYGKGLLDSDQAWSTQSAVTGDWWQFDLGSEKDVSGVVTQGRLNSNQWVTSFSVKVSSDGSSWQDVHGAHGEAQFGGNSDQSTKVENEFPVVAARYVRIYVDAYHSHPSMRSAVMICERPCDASTAPVNGGVGDCTASLASGSSCQPTCNGEYSLVGTRSCYDGTLSAASCGE